MKTMDSNWQIRQDSWIRNNAETCNTCYWRGHWNCCGCPDGENNGMKCDEVEQCADWRKKWRGDWV